MEDSWLLIAFTTLIFMGYHGLYQINDMKLKPVELWLIKRLIAAVSSASCPPDSSASLSTPCG